MITKQTETFNDGVVKIYKTKNVAESGRKTKEEPVYKGSFRFHERIVGNNRHYLAKQTGVVVERLVRCPRHRFVSAHDLVEVRDFANETINRYEIERIQYPEGISPKVMDITLVKNDWIGDTNV